MDIDRQQLYGRLVLEDYPRSAKYDAQWMIDNQMGPNVLWLTEGLSKFMTLKPGMRVLDMGCGKAASSIFLAREYSTRVWANDLWISADENWTRIREAGVEDLVYPMHAEARALPYAEGFFDALVSMDSYHYYGTDDLYLKYFSRLVKPGGQIGIIVPGLMREFGREVPEHLTRKGPSGNSFWDASECFSIHTADWWRRHWQQTGLVDIETVTTLKDGWKLWLTWAEVLDELGTGFDDEAPALRGDKGRYLGFVLMVARRRK